MLQTTPIIYAQEVAPAVLRPYLTTYVNMCWVRLRPIITVNWLPVEGITDCGTSHKVIGKLIGSGVLRGTLAIEGDLSWRITFAIQSVVNPPSSLCSKSE